MSSSTSVALSVPPRAISPPLDINLSRFLRTPDGPRAISLACALLNYLQMNLPCSQSVRSRISTLHRCDILNLHKDEISVHSTAGKLVFLDQIVGLNRVSFRIDVYLATIRAGETRFFFRAKVAGSDVNGRPFDFTLLPNVLDPELEFAFQYNCYTPAGKRLHDLDWADRLTRFRQMSKIFYNKHGECRTGAAAEAIKAGLGLDCDLNF